MRRGLMVVCVLTAALLGLAPVPAAAAPVFRISDPRIVEASGIAAGIRSPGVVYVQNDSGGSARFFALDAASGQVLTEFDVPSVTAVDWEDIAVAPDADGTPSVWLADIGDNMHERPNIAIYRVDEPTVDRAARETRTVTTPPPDVWRLRYPAEVQDAESLAVTPQGVPYLVTKSLAGRSVIYRAPAGGGVLQRVGAITFHFTGTPGPYPPIGQLAATGAAVSADGTRLVIRTYTDAYVWTVRRAGVPAALRTPPVRIALPEQPQGEGVCFDGHDLLLDSEGRGAPVYRVPVPGMTDRQSPSASSSAPPASSSAPPSSASSQPPSTPAADSEETPENGAVTYTLGALAAAAIAGLGLVVAVRRRRS